MTRSIPVAQQSTRPSAFSRAGRWVGLFAILALVFASSAVAEPWIHLKVEGENAEEVRVNLPLSMIQAAVAMVPQEAYDEATLELEEHDLDWYQLHEMWNSVRDAPEATFVSVRTADETVIVHKEGGFLKLETTEATPDGTSIDAKLPLEVVEALLSGPEGTFDVSAAFQALASYGPGELISIRDGETRVEVWIDETAGEP